VTQRTIYSVLVAVLLVVVLALLELVTGGVSAQGDSTPSPNLNDGLELAQNFSGRNADWTPVIQVFDGVEMVLVPAGCFEMGSTQYDDERPIHQVCFDEPFWLDRTDWCIRGGMSGKQIRWCGMGIPTARQQMWVVFQAEPHGWGPWT
jgi:hypothetical protein